jgi:cytochrome c oxidase assembly factor CtaG
VWDRGSVAVGALVVAAASVGGVLAVLDSAAYVRLAVPAPGPAFRLGLGALRSGVEVAGALAVGLLLHAAAVAVPQQPDGRRSGVLDVDGWRSTRRAGLLAVVAGLGALALGPLTASDLSGASVAAVLVNDPWSTFTALEEPAAWVVTGVLLTAGGAAATAVLTWRGTVLVGALSWVATLAPAVVGPAVTGVDHDRVVDAAIVQAAATPVLGLLVGLAAARDPLPAAPARRSLRLLVGMLAALTVAAAGSTALRLGPTTPMGTAWGALSSVRVVVALVALLVVVAAVRARRPPRPAVVAVLVTVVVVLGAVLARRLPPLFADAPAAGGADAPAAQENMLGYALPDPVSVARLLFDQRFNVLFGTAALLLAAGYLAGVRRLRRRGDAWPVGRTVAFLCGCAVLLLATSSGIGRFSPAVFSVHMAAHMLLNMLVPILLAIGGPVTLALRALPAAGRAAAPGPREWLAGIVGSPAARAVTHPLLALALFVGSFYVLYFTGLFDAALRYHWAHQAMNAHFLLVGYLFYWPLIGSDPAPVRLPHLGRLAVLLAAMPFHAFFGIAVMSSDTVLGGEFYRSLGLTWLPDLGRDQFLGGGIAWAAGELPMLLVVVVLLTRWARDDAREATRHDRRADGDGETELAAYNAMLARLSGTSAR